MTLAQGKPSHIEQLYTIFTDQHTAMYPELRPDPEKIRRLLTVALSGSPHFAVVDLAEDGREILGGLIALTSDMLWAQRKQSEILLWAGRSWVEEEDMIHAFVQWVYGRRNIRVAVFANDREDIPPSRLGRLVRAGFEKHGGVYKLINGARLDGTLQQDQERTVEPVAGR